MNFSGTVYQGKFLKRYKRFFADIKWNDEVITAHVPNTGSLKSVNNPESNCLFTYVDDPERKLKYTLQAIQAPTGAWVGVNTMLPNQLIKEAAPVLWPDLPFVKSEYKINTETRIDFALSETPFENAKKNTEHETKKLHFVEVKNVTLAENKGGKSVACFPDAVSVRAQKHVYELIQLMEQGHTAEIVFTIQRNDCEYFSPADDIDPEYGKALREGIAAGVIVSPYVISVSDSELKVIPYKLSVKI